MASRPRVLLVEDHPGVARALDRMLSFDCDVVGVIADGQAVADAVERLRPVVIVLDMHLQDVSGLEVCRQMRQKDPPVDVIVITAAADDATRDLALAAGASGFCHKSASKELVVAIKQTWTKST